MTQPQATYYLKLRNNIELEDDVRLAKLELEAVTHCQAEDIKDLSSVTQAYPSLANLGGPWSLLEHRRGVGQQGFCFSGSLSLLPVLIRRLSFIQSISGVIHATCDVLAHFQALQNDHGPVVRAASFENGVVFVAIPHYALLELSEHIVSGSRSSKEVQDNLKGLLGSLNSTYAAEDTTASIFAPRQCTSHLSHDIHYYKAKFFPRLARCLINVGVENVPSRDHVVLDGFAGSGTALLEASLLGLPSIGVDIDPLSVLISEAKTGVLGLASSALANEVPRLRELAQRSWVGQPSFNWDMPWTNSLQAPTNESPERLVLPPWLLKNRNMTPEMVETISREVGALREVIAQSDPAIRPFVRVLVSDALSKRLRMRFMGTGVGRFALTFSARTAIQVFVRALERYVIVLASWEYLRDTLRLQPASTEVLEGDARSLPCLHRSPDVIVTSPPYLPSSSGRESYAQARVLSLIALGFRDKASVDNLVGESVGAMNGGAESSRGLTAREAGVVEFLRGDELRSIKAEPTARYFLDMRKAFAEMRRVLAPNGVAMVISGKQNTFYRFSTREPLFVVPAAEVLAEEAQFSGLKVEELRDVKLVKSNMNARPRSLDDYYETILFLRNVG